MSSFRVFVPLAVVQKRLRPDAGNNMESRVYFGWKRRKMRRHDFAVSPSSPPPSRCSESLRLPPSQRPTTASLFSPCDHNGRTSAVHELARLLSTRARTDSNRCDMLGGRVEGGSIKTRADASVTH
eukprot:1115911-Rhodomonas_salina.1